MTSLAEAYEGHVGEVVSPERLYLGAGLFLVGVLLTVVGMIVATTDLAMGLGLDRMAAWRRAGVLAGLGVPAVMAGVFAVLPSSKRIKAAATIGAGISVLGVALFWYAYPTHWAGFGRDLTLYVTGVYFFGVITSVWCLFVGIANFKQRNNPGGTVSLRVTKESGETKVVEVDQSDLEDATFDAENLGAAAGAGGVGVFGSDPDGSVRTQTNDPSRNRSQGGTSRQSSNAGSGTVQHPAQASGAASDGGAEDREIRSLNYDGKIETPKDSARQYADRYCGNCEHFQYVRTETGMQPHCNFHAENMDDMEACEEWEPNH